MTQRERKREKDQLVASHTHPNWELNLHDPSVHSAMLQTAELQLGKLRTFSPTPARTAAACFEFSWT